LHWVNFLLEGNEDGRGDTGAGRDCSASTC
jgi:hypothetical protein